MLDCVGIGVGPFNLSLACLAQPCGDLTALFLEERTQFEWHQGMQLPGAMMQVSHFKDLVTLADPTNPYSFLNYLKAKGRLYQFINAKFDTVLRREFEDYLTWAFRNNPLIRPGHRVKTVSFDGAFHVTTGQEAFRTRALSVAVGRVPDLPACVADLQGPNILHSSGYLKALPKTKDKTICVVGGGQSGAEVFLDLLSRNQRERPTRIVWVTRRPNFEPLDDSPFANELFTPDYSDAHYRFDKTAKRLALQHFKLASDGISAMTLHQIYQSLYRHRFVDRTGLETALVPNVTLAAARRLSDGSMEMTLQPNRESAPHQERCDIAVMCTGYKPRPLTFLGDIKDRFDMVEGEPRVREDFSVVWDGPQDRKIYLHNTARFQRGVADPNLSLNAWRSQVILDSLRGRSAPLQQTEPSFLGWDHPHDRADDGTYAS